MSEASAPSLDLLSLWPLTALTLDTGRPTGEWTFPSGNCLGLPDVRGGGSCLGGAS